MTDEGLKESIEEVASVLQELKREVRSQGHQPAGAAPLAQTPSNTPRLAALERVHSLAQVNPHLPIAWPNWPSGLWPKIVAVAQKLVRRLLRWYINPIVEQQNRFNAAVAQSLDVLWAEVAYIQVQIIQNVVQHEPEGE
jgi:hypothetical protein